MEHFVHHFPDLFAQLGLPSDLMGIQSFIKGHTPLDPAIRLEDAPFWTSNQAHWLREELLHDADWAEVIDQLSVALRASDPIAH